MKTMNLQEEVKTTIREILQRDEHFEAYEQDIKGISDLPPLHSAVQVWQIKSYFACDVDLDASFLMMLSGSSVHQGRLVPCIGLKTRNSSSRYDVFLCVARL